MLKKKEATKKEREELKKATARIVAKQQAAIAPVQAPKQFTISSLMQRSVAFNYMTRLILIHGTLYVVFSPP